MGRITTIVPIMAIAAFAITCAANADSYDTVNPDGSVTRTNITADGQTKSVVTLSPPTRQTQADVIQRMAEAQAYRGTGRVDDSGIDTNRRRGRTAYSYPYPYVYPYPAYPAPGAYYSYPNYPYSYQLPAPNGSGAWITSIPTNRVYGYYHGYPSYPYPAYPNPYQFNNGNPYYNGYSPSGYPYVHGYGFGYGNGSYSSNSTSTYGGLSIGRGGVNVTIGGRNSSTNRSYSQH